MLINWLNKITKPGILPGRRLPEFAEKNDVDIRPCGMESVSCVLEHPVRDDDKVFRRFLSLYMKMTIEGRGKFLKYAVSISGR
ncbi:MAG TPA: hypothetical protein DET40_24610 [Lentisphaeria bacterium]|nr:MAG: hypothetical protein A2X45_22885 [Lentisphaerae bacterium GWF2_50_93]HCE46742.1 hypothetical protein [Lentisphaeria bacterium]